MTRLRPQRVCCGSSLRYEDSSGETGLGSNEPQMPHKEVGL